MAESIRTDGVTHLLRNSSLGTVGARALQRRAVPGEVEATRELRSFNQDEHVVAQENLTTSRQPPSSRPLITVRRSRAGIHLETDRLVLRPWTHHPDDLAQLADLYSQPSLVRFLGVCRDSAIRMVDDWSRRMANDPRQIMAAIEVRATGALVGTIMLNLLPGERHMEVGWHLHPNAEGHGYATEAARAVIDRGFRLGLPEVFAIVLPNNTRSQRVCRRLGMTHLGRTIRYHDTEYELFHLVAGRRTRTIRSAGLVHQDPQSQ
jgi:RimJ/RimL family protein N-acetyltransferase